MGLIEYVLIRRSRELYRYTVEEKKYSPKLYWKTKKNYLLIDDCKKYTSKLLYASNHKRLLCIMRDIWRYKRVYGYPYTYDKPPSNSLDKFLMQRNPKVDQEFEAYMDYVLGKYYVGGYNFIVKKLDISSKYYYYIDEFEEYCCTHIIHSDQISFLSGEPGHCRFSVLRKYLYAKQSEGTTLIIGSDWNTYKEFPGIKGVQFFRIYDLSSEVPYADVEEDALFMLLDLLYDPQRYRQSLDNAHTVIIDCRWKSISIFLLKTIEQTIKEYTNMQIIFLFNDVPALLSDHKEVKQKKEKGDK
ncbi:hypothetical protein [Breznakia pachnodae]|uniref:Uncharacterized protein n=1 Tax=Breznakia pachnodae TaxID=265178 RepID=A0ABU0E777_9FIRM|nr:hypothetical protein [Breznakia pachnodae]MDQ0362558.1 hypothetical protein [Breznakia pachnodae]